MRTVGGKGVMLNGFDLVGMDSANVSWKVHDVENWDSPPATGGEVFPFAYADGGWAGEAHNLPHPLRLKGRLLAPDLAAAEAAGEAFRASIPAKVFAPLVVSKLGRVRHRMVRQEGSPVVRVESDQLVTFDIQMVDTDTRLLDGDGPDFVSGSDVARLPITTGGLAIPAGGLAAPFQIVATVTGSSVTVGAEGTARPRMTATIAAVNEALVNPQVTDDLGNRMRLNLTLAVGQFVVLDFDQQSIMLNGVASRRSSLRGPWMITPRPGMTLSFDAEGYTSTNQATCTVAWTNAW